MHYFEVPKLQKWFRNKINHSTPLDTKRCLRVFRSISQTFNTLNEAKLVFQTWMHYFRVSKLGKWFRNEIIHSNPLDPTWCLRVFRSTSQTFDTSNEAKLVFWVGMHYFEIPKLQKWFCNEISHSMPLDPKWYLRVFRSISQNFDTSNEAKLVFRPWMHYFGLPKLQMWFCNEIIHSTPLDQKWCLEVFRSNSQTFGMSNDAKFVFRT